MGKSPGKWIKSVLLGKKSSKSGLARGEDVPKSANKGQVLVSPKEPVSDLIVGPPLILAAVAEPDVPSGVETDCGVTPNVLIEGLTRECSKENENAKEVAVLGSKEDLEMIRLEKAATEAQAAVRGYLARRSFRTLKGIIKLQAFVRGHLVRRQAITTLRCVQAIVKLQALARGQKVRRSTIGIEIQSNFNLLKVQGAKHSDFPGICTPSMPTPAERMNESDFTRKLLASSSAAIPLCLQYGPGNPNLAWEWLERWTRSQSSESHLHLQSKQDKFPAGKQREDRPKKSIRKQPKANTENTATRSISEPDKQKRKPRKPSSHLVDTVQEHQQNEIVKTSHSSRKASDSKEGGERFEVDNRKPKVNMRKVSSAEKGNNVSVAKMKDSAAAVSKESGTDASLKVHGIGEQVGLLQEHTDSDLQPTSNPIELDSHGTEKLLIPADDYISNENQTASQKRTSFPLNFKHEDNGIHTTPKLPSYMVPTESAKAKLRAQGSPRLSQDGIEKNVINRRLSLPSSTNGKLTSMSPRAQNLVNSAGRGVVRSDKSLSVSRDGSVSDKVLKPEWRR